MSIACSDPFARRPRSAAAGLRLAATGLEAVAKAVAFAPDIAIIESKMPLLDGLAAAVEIRKRAPAVEVLLFSGANSLLALQRMFHSSVRGCLLKTETLEGLIPAVETIRRHRRFRSPGITLACKTLAETDAARPRLTRRENPHEQRDRRPARGQPQDNRTHRTRLFRKLGVRSAVELVLYAVRHRLIEP